MSNESKILRILFEIYKHYGIRYAVLRNYENMPLSTNGSDLDIWINSKDIIKGNMATTIAIRKANGTIVGMSRAGQFFKVTVLGKESTHKSNKEWWGLCIDINYGIKYRSVNIINETSFYDQIAEVRGVNVVKEPISSVLGIIKEVLNNNVIENKYLPIAQQCAQKSWERITDSLSPLGEKGLELLREIIINGNTKYQIIKRAKELRKYMYINAIHKYPYESIKSEIEYEISKFMRYIYPSGKILALMGTDGAGKTTTILQIKPLLDRVTHNEIYIKHLRPGLLPPLSRLKGKRKSIKGPILYPHALPASGITVSLIRFMYLLTDYIFGYWLKIRFIIAKKPSIIIYDRYAYDMIIDPRRFRINLSNRVMAWFMRLVPRPDIIICLHAPIKVIVSRKSELPIDESERQNNKLLELAKHEPRAILISTMGNVKQVRNRVLNKLFEIIKKSAIGLPYHE